MNVELYFLSAGIVLAAMGTYLSPLLAFSFYQVFKKKDRGPVPVASDPGLSLDILIPAHNEPLSLPASIQSLRKIRAQAPTVFTQIKIVVGLSRWSGAEAMTAAEGADAVLEISAAGKWQALRTLVMNSTADWVALVDAGVIWEEACLDILAPVLCQSSTLAVNPRFQELKRGRLQKLIWTFESTLKQLENRCGGPISLHGATVFYRRENLQKALLYLEGTEWLNDDVVLPLTMRALFPEMKIIYSLETAVTDRYPSWNTSELQRRKRLLFGNIQWVQKFYFKFWTSQPLLAALATRRVARMVWAWWFFFLGLGTLFLALTVGGPVALVTLMAVGLIFTFVGLRSSSGRRLLEAFWISLVFPVYFLSFCFTGKLPQWK